MKLGVRPILTLCLSMFSKQTLPNVFSTLQSKLGGGITFFLRCCHGHFKVLIYMFQSTCPPAPAAFCSCSTEHLFQRTGPAAVCIAWLKGHCWQCKSVGHVAEVKQPLRARQMDMWRGPLPGKETKRAHRTIRPARPVGICTHCKMSSCLEILLHGEGGLSRQGLPTYSAILHDFEWIPE